MRGDNLNNWVVVVGLAAWVLFYFVQKIDNFLRKRTRHKQVVEDDKD